MPFKKKKQWKSLFIYSRMFLNLSGSPCDFPLHAIIWTVHTVFENLLWQFYLICEIKVIVALPANNLFHKSKNMLILFFSHRENCDFKYFECFRSLTMYLIMWIALLLGVIKYRGSANVSEGLDNTTAQYQQLISQLLNHF